MTPICSINLSFTFGAKNFKDCFFIYSLYVHAFIGISKNDKNFALATVFII